MSLFFEGFFLQTGLILALGAQNIFVLESGLKKQRPLLVALLCSLCDLTLILIGVAGAASIFVQNPVLKFFVGLLGIAFLMIYALKKFHEAYKGGAFELSDNQQVISVKRTIALALGFSLLNPHVYLDTIVLIGGYSAAYSQLSERILFGLGAAGFSALWFFSLAFGAMRLHKFFQKESAVRWMNFTAAAILTYLSFKLGHEVLSWNPY